MKYVPFLDTAEMKGRDIVEAILKHPGERGATLQEMRARNRIWDALDANTDPVGIQLEDADADKLIALYQQFPFGAATRELLRHVEAVVGAKAPPAVMLPAKSNGKNKQAEAH